MNRSFHFLIKYIYIHVLLVFYFHIKQQAIMPFFIFFFSSFDGLSFDLRVVEFLVKDVFVGVCSPFFVVDFFGSSRVVVTEWLSKLVLPPPPVSITPVFPLSRKRGEFSSGYILLINPCKSFLRSLLDFSIFNSTAKNKSSTFTLNLEDVSK